jgi:hypothetical protein
MPDFHGARPFENKLAVTRLVPLLFLSSIMCSEAAAAFGTGWGVRVRRPFGARGRSSVRYGTRLGDLKNKHSKHTTMQSGAFPDRANFA